MKQWFTSMLFAALAVSCAPGWNQVPPLIPVKHPRSPRCAGHRRSGARIFTMELTKSVDSKKLKDGDELTPSW